FSVQVNLFFFSRRRRHTRFSRDWSSDVCSSDLGHARFTVVIAIRFKARSLTGGYPLQYPRYLSIPRFIPVVQRLRWRVLPIAIKIGRASCRERGHVVEVAIDI